MKRLLGIMLAVALLGAAGCAGAEAFNVVEFSSVAEKKIYADHGDRLGDVNLTGHMAEGFDTIHRRYAIQTRITHETFVDHPIRLVGMVDAGAANQGVYKSFEFRVPKGESFVPFGRGYTEAMFYLETVDGTDSLSISGVRLGVKLVIDAGGEQTTLATSWYTLP